MAHCKHCKQELRLGRKPHQCSEGDASSNEKRNTSRSAAACSPYVKHMGAVTISRNGYIQEVESERDKYKKAIAKALETLWSCGLHPKYHPDLKTAAEGVRETVRQLRRDISDPSHDIQCRVLEKLGVDGFAKPENTTHRLVMFNPNSPHNETSSSVCATENNHE